MRGEISFFFSFLSRGGEVNAHNTLCLEFTPNKSFVQHDRPADVCTPSYRLDSKLEIHGRKII